jgi:TonB-linked SusC/RagA family outer membrane protein
MTGIVVRRLMASAAVALLPAWASAQDQGLVTGRVVDQATSLPIPDAQVQVLGTTRGARTDADGRYRIGGLPAGEATVRAARIGYRAATQPVTVSATGPVTADFALSAAAVALDQIVVTATGETQLARESGNSIGRIEADSVDRAAVKSFSDVLQSRVSGLTVTQATGTTGGSSRIRIRGANSISLENEPLLIVDGVRVSNANASFRAQLDPYIGGQEPSRFNDLNPDDMEEVQVLKGPAASALYGTAAANGVIVVTTKRGRTGRTRWGTHAEYGTVTQPYDFPGNYQQVGVLNATGDRTANCNIARQAAAACTPNPDSLTAFAPFDADNPFRDGWQSSVGLNVSGGAGATTYYFSGDLNREQGVYEVSRLSRVNLQGNVRAQIRENLDMTVTTGYVNSRLQLPQNDNNILGVFGGGLLGGTEDDPVSHGYILGQTAKEIFAIQTRQDVQRFTGGVNTNWQILPWLRGVGQAGLDFVARTNNELTPPNRVFFADLPQGARTSNPYRIFNYTANGGLTATFNLMPELVSTTSGGVQYQSEITRGTQAFGRGLAAGSGSLSGTTAGFQVNETNVDNITIGGYLQQQLGWADRRFLTVAARTDRNSAFGEDFGFITYPSVSASWVVSEETYFPRVPALSSLRLRGAYGQAGRQPNFRDAVTYYSVVSVRDADVDIPGITPGAPAPATGGLGNADLKPERSSEFELGFDLGLFDGRVGLDLTYFDKTTEDALIAVPTVPSGGVADQQFRNLGEVSNKGLELLLNANVFTSNPFSYSFTFNASTIKNRLVRLGQDTPILLNNGAQRHTDGKPLGAYYQIPITYSDANGDGLLNPDDPAEVSFGDEPVYLGPVLPTRTLSWRNDVTFYNLVKVSGLIDYQGGHTVYNQTESFRCQFNICRGYIDNTAPLAEQAAAIGIIAGGTDAGFLEDGDFVKLRELAFTLMVPRDWSGRFGVDDLSLTVAGRNLKTWTDYTGFDPEVNSSPFANFSTSDFLTQPPVRYWTTRINVSF